MQQLGMSKALTTHQMIKVFLKKACKEIFCYKFCIYTKVQV